MVEQGRKLTKMINTAVNALDRLDAIVPAVQQLGVRHIAYGVEDEHYDTVGAALSWTLDAGPGDAFTEDVKEAWATVYGILADTMKDAAKEAAA
jgi:hemoglobin-like flavoprotein